MVWRGPVPVFLWKPRVIARFSWLGLDSPFLLDLRMGRWGRGGIDKSSGNLFLFSFYLGNPIASKEGVEGE